MATKIMPDQAYLCECLEYDSLQGTLLWKIRPRSHFCSVGAWRTWNTRFSGNAAGWKHGVDGRVYVAIDGRKMGAARVIWKMMTGSDPEHLIDHEDTDPSNNVWENLRPATRVQNNRNSKGRGAQLKGAYARGDRWTSMICVNRKIISLGRFDTAQDAHDAYCAASLKYHGKFSNTAARTI